MYPHNLIFSIFLPSNTVFLPPFHFSLFNMIYYTYFDRSNIHQSLWKGKLNFFVFLCDLFSGLDAPAANRRQLWQQQSEELLESATNKQIDDLEATIGGLKQLGNDIHVEIGRSNSILDELVRHIHFFIHFTSIKLYSRLLDATQRPHWTTVLTSKFSLLLSQRSGVDNTGGLLSAAQKKLKEVSESGSNRLMCYLVLFVILVFFIIYGVISWSSGAPSSTSSTAGNQSF
jgi:hypothetical protein